MKKSFNEGKPMSRVRKALEIVGDVAEAIVGIPVYIVLAAVAVPAAIVGAISKLASRKSLSVAA